jgi:hypothetical protein
MIYREFNIEAGYMEGYDYSHVEIDGAPDSEDNRMGHEKTIEACKEAIDQWHLDNTPVMLTLTVEELLSVQLALSVYYKQHPYSWLKRTGQKIDQALVEVQKDIEFEREYNRLY